MTGMETWTIRAEERSVWIGFVMALLVVYGGVWCDLE